MILLLKMFLACFPLTPIIMKLHTETPHELRMCPIDLGSKGQMSRSQCIDYWNGFWHIIALPFHLSSWNCIHRLPMSWRCALLRWGSKGQMSWSQCIDTENDNLCIIAVPVYLSSWNFTWVKVPYCGKKFEEFELVVARGYMSRLDSPILVLFMSPTFYVYQMYTHFYAPALIDWGNLKKILFLSCLFILCQL